MGQRDENAGQGRDLRALSGGGAARGRSEPRRPKGRSWRGPVLLVGLVAAAAGVLVLAGGERFRSSISVEVVRPIRAGGGSAGGASEEAGVGGGGPTRLLARAAGWVEPHPMALNLPALRGGVVAELGVVPGQDLAVGEQIGSLLEAEERIALRAAEALVATVESEREAARGLLAAAEKQLEEGMRSAVLVEEHTARVEAFGESLLEARAQERQLEGEAKVILLEKEAAEALGFGVAGARQRVKLARAALEGKRAAQSGAKARTRRLEAELKGAQELLRLVRADHESRRPEALRVAEAQADRTHSETKLGAAQADLARAQLAVERSELRSLFAGRVHRVLVAPGDAVSSGQTVVAMHDPKSLRVRVDVPLEDVSAAARASEVRIVAESRRDQVYRGRIARIVPLADAAKVTAPVWVLVEEPDEHLRPETLCRVEFHGSGAGPAAAGSVSSEGGESGGGTGALLKLPASAVLEDGGVWVVGADERLQRRTLTVVSRDSAVVRVSGALDVSDRVVKQPSPDLEVGRRVAIVGPEAQSAEGQGR